MEATPRSLNEHQLEILKLLSRDLDQQDLVAIKRLIVNYLADKAKIMADKVWEEKGWSQNDMDRMLQTHERTKYDPQN